MCQLYLKKREMEMISPTLVTCNEYHVVLDAQYIVGS